MVSPAELTDLLPHEYEHPFDAKALNALQKMPGLDVIIRKFNSLAVERPIKIQYTGSNIRITTENYPNIHRILDRVCDVINLPARPELYLEFGYHINGFTIGVDHPIIVLTSGSIDLLSEEELLFLIGHEVGHIKSRHTLYHQMGNFFPMVAETMGQATLGLSKMLSTPLQLALMHWSRMSEFTADRAGLLACQDLETAAKVMIKLAGMPIQHYDDMKMAPFLSQARQFESLDYEMLNKVVKYIAIMGSSHPWTVMRAAELLKWVESGRYQQIIERTIGERRSIMHEGESQFCRHCSFKLEGDEKFCPGCGSNLRD